MRASVQAIILLLFGLAILLAGKRWGAAGSEQLVQTDTVYVDRPILRRDTVTIVRPDTRVIYRTVRDTVRIEVPVPRGFQLRGVIAPNPIRFDGGNVVLTYFAPDASAWQQDYFKMPRPRWEFWAAARFAAWPNAGFGVEAAGRWRMVGAFVQADAFRDDYRITTGLRLYVINRSR